MRHFAWVFDRKWGESGKMAWQMSLLPPLFPAANPCENELFAAEGQIMVCAGSHNVKIYTENFTFFFGNEPDKTYHPHESTFIKGWF